MSQPTGVASQLIGSDMHEDGDPGAACAFLQRLPREIRDKIYKFVLQVEPTTTFKDGAIMRVNHQIHDEATAILLEQNIFVLVSFHSLQTVAKQMIHGDNGLKAVLQTGAEGPVTAFKGYSMRLVVRDPKDKKHLGKASRRVHLMLLASSLCLGQLSCLIAKVQSHPENVAKIPPSRLSYHVAFEALLDGIETRKALEIGLLHLLTSYWWDFPHMSVTGALDKDHMAKVLAYVSRKRWNSPTDVFGELNELLRQTKASSNVMHFLGLLRNVELIYEIILCQNRYKPWIETAEWKRHYRAMQFNSNRLFGCAYLELAQTPTTQQPDVKECIVKGKKAADLLTLAWKLAQMSINVSDRQRSGLLNLLGCAYVLQADAKAAQKHFTLAKQYDPGNSAALHNFAVIKTATSGHIYEVFMKLSIPRSDNEPEVEQKSS